MTRGNKEKHSIERLHNSKTLAISKRGDDPKRKSSSEDYEANKNFPNTKISRYCFSYLASAKYQEAKRYILML